MPDKRKLKKLDVDELLQELKAREAKKKGGVVAALPATASSLAGFDDATLVSALKAKQKVIYGTDDRIDVFQLTAGPELDDTDCVVALFQSSHVVDNGDGTSTLQTQNFGTSRSLCGGEPFRNQPTGAFCSGFLVGSDIIATAGHCVDAGNVTDVRFVFGFRMQNATTPITVIQNSEIYSGVSMIGRQEVNNGPDWALVRIDRPVNNHLIAPIRRTGTIPNGESVHVIGHPSGLPIKFADGANVRDNTPPAFFVANLDTYGGNSGSPVFNNNTHQVEGILVRGEADFVQQGTCFVSQVCPNTGCRGEDCTRTTEFANLVPLPQITPTITWADPANIVFGSPLTINELGATASVPGTFAYTPPVGTCLPTGTHTLSTTFTPDDPVRFTTATATVQLNVVKATPVLTWTNPPDIDEGDPLPNAAMNATADWVECGTPVSVPGTFSYTPSAGALLPVGTHTLNVCFTPTDAANYKPTCSSVVIHVLTGYPIVMAATFAPTTLAWEEAVQVSVTVKNDSVRGHVTQGPNPGFEYSEGDTYASKGFPPVEGAYRVGVDLDETTYAVNYLYRWGFGHDLAPGEVVTVNGAIRFHNSRHNGHYYVGMLQETDRVVQDHQGMTAITVRRP